MTTTAARCFLHELSEEPSSQALIEPEGPLQPENRLMLAVLEGAVRDFQTYATASTGRGRQIFIEADGWFRAHGAGPFSFETICHATGLDPEYVREGLRRWYGERWRQRAPVQRTHLLAAANQQWAPLGRGLDATRAYQ